MLLKRVITAIIGIPFFIYMILKGGLYWSLFVAVLGVLGSYEVFKASFADTAFETLFSPQKKLFFIIMQFFISAWLISAAFVDPCLGGALLFVVMSILALVRPEPSGTLVFIGLPLFVMAFIGVPVIYLMKLRSLPNGAFLVLALFTAVWALDTGAYFSGRLLGKHGFHSFSPKKTLEGAIGGTLSVIFLFLIYYRLIDCRCLFYTKLLNWSIIADNFRFFASAIGPVGLALTVSFLGQAGDLLESAVKRDLKIKDSSNILPGHGGIYDRFDSIFLAAPVYFYVIKYMF